MDVLAQGKLGFEKFVAQYVGHAWREFPEERAEYLSWDSLPLTSVWAPVLGAIFYMAFLKFVSVALRNRKPMDKTFPIINTLLIYHNLALCLLSAAMCVGTLASVAAYALRYGPWASMADPDWRLPENSISFWCYIFYISKYYELADTAFLVIKKKPVRFVQKWHHATVLFLFWANNEARMLNHWPLVALNSFVHIFVYGYFFANSLKIPVPWKRYITLLQISQFVVDMLYSLPFPFLKHLDHINGDWGPWMFGQFIGATFLVLFTDIYIANRRKAMLAKGKKAA